MLFLNTPQYQIIIKLGQNNQLMSMPEYKLNWVKIVIFINDVFLGLPNFFFPLSIFILGQIFSGLTLLLHFEFTYSGQVTIFAKRCLYLLSPIIYEYFLTSPSKFLVIERIEIFRFKTIFNVSYPF